MPIIKLKQWPSRASRHLTRLKASLPRISSLFPRIGALYDNELSPADYDMHERRGGAQHSIPILMAFKPVSYQAVNFPVHVDEEVELARYVDHNFEAEVPALYKPGASFAPIGYFNRFTHDEAELIGSVRDKVASFSAGNFGRRVRPATNLLVQMGPFRMIRALGQSSPTGKLRVFEIGPGAGYLGAMLAMSGHDYLSYDVTQSWYLWQNRLLRAVADKDFRELAGERDFPARLPPVVHLPWWMYVSFLTGCPIKVDMVYSNSNLCEMSPLALKIALTISANMLSDSPLGLFTFFSHGSPAQTAPEALEGAFEAVGFKKVLDEPFQAYSTRPQDVGNALKVFENGIPHFDPSSRGGDLEANDVVPFGLDEAPLDTTITAWHHGWEPPYKR